MPQNKLTTLQRLALAAEGLDSRGRDYKTSQPGAPASELLETVHSRSHDNNSVPRSHPLEHYLLSASASREGDEGAFEGLEQELPATLFALMYGYDALTSPGTRSPRL